jgi:hypothetical protein
VCIIAVIAVLLPPVITTVIEGNTIGVTRGITGGITEFLLFGIISPVAFDYLVVLLQLLLALLFLPPALLLRGCPLQSEDLFLQVRVALRWPLEEILDTIIASACPRVFSIEVFRSKSIAPLCFFHYRSTPLSSLVGPFQGRQLPTVFNFEERFPR